MAFCSFDLDSHNNLIFVVPCIMLYSGEISPTNATIAFFIRNGFTLVSKFRLLCVDEFNICGSVHHAL